MAESNFLGKTAMLEWLNSGLGLRLERIEDVSRCLASALASSWGRLRGLLQQGLKPC